jgi:ABC-type uncharacterized transport system auxiliary subunit
MLLRWLMLTLALASAAGCMPSLESGEPPERVYWLEPVDVTSSVSVQVDVSVVPGLEGDRIWILQPDQRLNYYAGAFWADSVAPLLSSVLDRSLNGAGAVAQGVAVEVLIERFFAVEAPGGAPPEIELAARIRGTASEPVVCLIRETRRAGSSRLRDIVAAHQALTEELARAVARFAASQAEGRAASC